MFAYLGLGRSGPAAAARSAPSSQPPTEVLPSPHRPALSRVASPAASPRRSSLAQSLLNSPAASPPRSSLAPHAEEALRDGHLVIVYSLLRDPLDLVERGERGLLLDTRERLITLDLCELVKHHDADASGVLRWSSHLHENAAVRRNKLARDAVRLELREFLKELG
ncbi:hypothetical protein T492DRAFT_1016870 [Pavlovales sp. CCMP2436]|nr:hypothetical protein T492DRAFT_1016870 [Pavlovales sp. CCMP2436]